MLSARTNVISAVASLGFAIFAVTFSTATVASRQGQTHVYHGVLRDALLSELLALCSLAIPLFRGPRGWRVAAVLLALPAVFVFSEVARRAPELFGGG